MTLAFIHAEKEIGQLLAGKRFNRLESLRLFTKLFRGDFPEPSSQTLLTLMAERRETAEEVAGAFDALLKVEEQSKKFKGKFPQILDTCGTGGDGSSSLNLSTLSSFVVAACDVCVAKHGNRAITSKCGSSDLIEGFKIRLDPQPQKINDILTLSNIAYLHAPSFHPVFKRFQALRKKIKMKTIFNILGPISNPIQVTYQLLGVSNPDLINIYADTLSLLRKKGRALIFYNSNGMDELTTASKSSGILVEGKRKTKIQINPRQFGLKPNSTRDLRITSVADAVRRSELILRGKDKTATTDVVALNAGYALWVAKKTASPALGIKIAKQKLTSGEAWEKVIQLRKLYDS